MTAYRCKLLVDALRAHERPVASPGLVPPPRLKTPATARSPDDDRLLDFYAQYPYRGRLLSCDTFRALYTDSIDNRYRSFEKNSERNQTYHYRR